MFRMLGRIAHYTFDAVLVSTVLAGVKRHTGFTPESDPNAKLHTPVPLISSNDTTHYYFRKYLGVGEYVFDRASGFASRSVHFKKVLSDSDADAEGIEQVAERLRSEGVKKGERWLFGGGKSDKV
ncbi:unnamed protein product [Jaminaea pallidilutea]